MWNSSEAVFQPLGAALAKFFSWDYKGNRYRFFKRDFFHPFEDFFQVLKKTFDFFAPFRADGRFSHIQR